MNVGWFDELARELGRGVDRRGAVTRLAGVISGTVLGVVALGKASAACVKPGKKFRKGKKCCQGSKKKGKRCRCVGGGTPCGKTCCTAPEVCAPTAAGGVTCIVPDVLPGEICDPDIPQACTTGVCGCGPGGCTCRVETCAAAGESCNTNTDCCDDLCYALEGYICGPLP